MLLISVDKKKKEKKEEKEENDKKKKKKKKKKSKEKKTYRRRHGYTEIYRPFLVGGQREAQINRQMLKKRYSAHKYDSLLQASEWSKRFNP